MADRASQTLGEQLAGIDALEIPLHPRVARLQRFWESAWPKLVAAGLFMGIWQLVAWSGWKADYVLPGPATVFTRLFQDLVTNELTPAIAVTMRRAVVGYSTAIALGSLIGLLVSLNRTLRTAVGSGISAIQTMPSIAWFPLAILLFGLTEKAIFAVVVLGAAPSIANGLIHGVDHTPRILLRAGRVLGARGFASLRHVVVPGALPGYVAGLKQGWAFAWRSLMAGELLVIIAKRPSLGVRLQFARELSDASGLITAMLTIFAIGLVVDSLLFQRIEQAVLLRWGLRS